MKYFSTRNASALKTLGAICAAIGIFLLISLGTPALAVPAYPYPTSFTQPDGKVIQVQGKGDEFLNWTEDLEGNLVVFDPVRKGICYAHWTNGGAVSTGELVGPSSVAHAQGVATARSKGKDIPQGVLELADMKRQEQSRWLEKMGREIREQNAKKRPGISLAPSTAPSMTDVENLKRKLLIIHATWDNRSNISPAKLTGKQIHDLVFNPETRSVNDYYQELFGQTEMIITPATVINPMDGFQGIVEVQLSGSHPGTNASTDIMHRAIIAASENGHINYADFAQPGATTLLTRELSVGVIIDGYENAFGGVNAPTPNFWGSAGGVYSPPANRTNNVRLQSAFGQGAFHNYDPLTIGIIAHEMAHSGYGMWDTYDYGWSDGTSQGHGRWSAMASGSWTRRNNSERQGDSPCYVDADNLVSLNYVIPGILVPGAENVTLDTHLAIYQANSTESNSQYFLLQQRKYGANDNYDRACFYGIAPTNANATSGGLLIYHIDRNVTQQSFRYYDKNSHYRGAILEAHGGTQHLQQVGGNSGGLDDLWGTAKRSLHAFSDPSSNLYSPFTTTVTPPTKTIISGVEINDITWNSAAGRTTLGFTQMPPGLRISDPPLGLLTGEIETFHAAVIGIPNQTVVWSILSGGGTFGDGGQYTAPNSPGNVTIKATSVADPQLSDLAHLKISDRGLGTDNNTATAPNLLGMAFAFGVLPADPRYDLNGDGVVNELDLLILFKGLGWL
jgi:M6 family metalloprotease-like protein